MPLVTREQPRYETWETAQSGMKGSGVLIPLAWKAVARDAVLRQRFGTAGNQYLEDGLATVYEVYVRESRGWPEAGGQQVFFFFGINDKGQNMAVVIEFNAEMEEG